MRITKTPSKPAPQEPPPPFGTTTLQSSTPLHTHTTALHLGHGRSQRMVRRRFAHATRTAGAVHTPNMIWTDTKINTYSNTEVHAAKKWAINDEDGRTKRRCEENMRKGRKERSIQTVWLILKQCLAVALKLQASPLPSSSTLGKPLK